MYDYDRPFCLDPPSYQVHVVLMGIWTTLVSVCGKKKVEPEDEGDSPNSLSPSSSSTSTSGHVTIDMEPPVDRPVNPAPPVDKPTSPVDKPASPVHKPDTPSTPVSAGKRVQTPVKPIKGAGPEPNPSVVSSKQTQLHEDSEVFV